METLPLSRKRLANITAEARVQEHKDKILRIVREITTNVVAYAKKGYSTYTYPRCGHLQHIAIDIVAFLKINFPDCDVRYVGSVADDSIVIDWS